MTCDSGVLESTQRALDAALDDEYRARRTYRAVVDRFGALWPFGDILRARQQRVEALQVEYARLGIPVPTDSWPELGEAPATVSDACRLCARAEAASTALYDDLIATTVDADVIDVFNRLRQDSRVPHLVDLLKCLALNDWGCAPGPLESVNRSGRLRGGHER